MLMIVFFGLYTYINIPVPSPNLMENVLVAAENANQALLKLQKKHGTLYSTRSAEPLKINRITLYGRIIKYGLQR